MRKPLGYVLLAISCVAWLAVPVIPFLPLSALEKASWVGGVIIFAEIAWWLAMPLLGKEIIAWCKNAWQWCVSIWHKCLGVWRKCLCIGQKCKRRLGFKSAESSGEAEASKTLKTPAG